jgi:hypothetical protein
MEIRVNEYKLQDYIQKKPSQEELKKQMADWYRAKGGPDTELSQAIKGKYFEKLRETQDIIITFQCGLHINTPIYELEERGFKVLDASPCKGELSQAHFRPPLDVDLVITILKDTVIPVLGSIIAELLIRGWNSRRQKVTVRINLTKTDAIIEYEIEGSPTEVAKIMKKLPTLFENKRSRSVRR